MTEKRSVSLAGHRTSVALEPEFWDAVERIAAERGQSLSGYVAAIDRARRDRNLASALRVAVLLDLEARLRQVEAAGLGEGDEAG
ncbi:ribbon-helix-helix domain-containing protein [Mongoliimonas terrestris]|uniref:ribbon-helix-helix domain-containing protein n=1 Tax=Mongoliimonas terrestris TaxID=1709001 RepID=UPI0009496FF8|nr:ribbon-helix-helix domain-containing protein [Mongoliimonas terrestris]